MASALLGLTLGMPGCSSAGARSPEVGGRDPAPETRGLDEADRYLRQRPAPAGDRPALMVDGESIAFDALRNALCEAAGDEVVRQAVLDARLRAEAARAGVTLTKDMIENERARFESTLGDAGVGGDDAGAVLDRVRRRRGLGPARYSALLARNALLRALIQPEVSVTDASLEQASELRFGERRRVRVIITPTFAEAGRALERLSKGEAFSAVAADLSSDVSSSRGGAIGTVSAADPAFPLALRRAVSSAGVGEPTQPVAIDSGFAIALVDEVVPRAEPGPDATEVLRRDARERQERLLMDSLARRLASPAGVRVLDPALSWSAGG